MASFVFNTLIADMAAGNIQTASHSFKMMLVSSSYTPSRAHAKRSDITNEITGTGYTAGGAACTVTVATDQGGNRTSMEISDTSWSNATLTARRGVVYRTRGGASSADELVCCLDFLGDITSTAGTFLADFNASVPFFFNTP